MNGNYIKICRSILDWEWFKNPNTLAVFVYCLLRANWKDGRFEGIEVPRGSFVTSVAKLAKEVGISTQSARTALNHLKSTNELTITSTPKFSVITVNNYNRYQDANKQSNKRLTNDQQTANKQLTTIEERKKGKKKEGKNNKYYPNDEKLDQAFRDYVEMRKEIKAPMTDRAITLAINKLEKLATVNGAMDNDLAIGILEQSTMNSWKGLFELKQSTAERVRKVDDWI
ncbi:MAG: hypothetical protein LUD72_11310 [Bacteroidales bacterium]|nr:hypothetical protein [Bacteroidales bacterium]